MQDDIEIWIALTLVAGIWLVAGLLPVLARALRLPEAILWVASTILTAGAFFAAGEWYFETIKRNDLEAFTFGGAAALGGMLAAWSSHRFALPRPRPAGISPLAAPAGGAPAGGAPAGGAPDVFISYKREERAAVEQLAQRLKARGLKVWFDAELRSGATFDAEIERNVRTAKCVLVCWSPAAAASDWVRAEATIGRERDALAAVMLAPCSLPPPFNLVHYEDLTGGIEASPAAWASLLQRVALLVDRT